MSSPITVEAGTLLESFRGDLQPILAENGQTFDRLRSTFVIAVQQNPDILKCTADSLRREISKCAVDGLVPDSREAVLLPYWDKDARAHLANYQPMVYGIIKRMKELGSVFNIIVEVVCENDTFTFNAADPDSLSHSWDVFSETPRGATRAAYVIFRDDQKRVMHREIMTLAELQAVRAASKAPNSPAWRNFESEMYQKAVLRRGSKYISINNDKIRMLIERQDAMFDFSRPRTAERIDPFSGKMIEGEAREVGQEAPAEQRAAPEAPTSGAAAADEAKGTPQPPPLPDMPEVLVAPMDKDQMVAAAERLLAVALQKSSAKDRRALLKSTAAELKRALPEYLHPLAKACIDMADWAIRRDADGAPWATDHARFVHQMKELLGVEKFDVGKYP